MIYKSISKHKVLIILGVLALSLIPIAVTECCWANRIAAYHYLSSLYGDHFAMDKSGDFYVRLNLDEDFRMRFIERVDEDDIHNDIGVSAEVVRVSIEDNLLMLRYQNETLENAHITIDCKWVEKWIAGDWYNVTFFTSQRQVQYQLNYKEETRRTLRLCTLIDPETNFPATYVDPIYIANAKLIRPDPGLYRLVLPIYTDSPLDFYTDKKQDHFYITAEFELP